MPLAPTDQSQNTDVALPSSAQPSRGGTSPIGTTSPNTGATAATNSTYAQGAFASGISTQASTTYTLQNTDYQGIVLFNTSSAITVTLNGSVNTNFTCIILNLGTGAITLTPNMSYTVNGASTLALGSGQGAQVFFAARTWLAYAGTTVLQVVPVNTPAVSHEWLASYNSTTGAFTQTQPAFTDVSGVATTAQIGTGTPGAGKYIDGAAGAWTTLPAAAPAVIPINAQTISYAALVGDLGKVIQMNAAGATTVTLPVTFATGFWLWVKNVGAGTCTVSATSGNIDSHASIAITTAQAYQFYWDGSQWRQLSQSLSA